MFLSHLTNKVYYNKLMFVFSRNSVYFCDKSITYYTMNLQETIRSRRRTLGISQNDLAEMSGISPATIKNIERGSGNPSFSTIARIMEVLGMDILFRVKNPFENPESRGE